MPSTTQIYDALPSETTSISRSLSQQDSPIHHEKAEPSDARPNTKFLHSFYISRLWVSWKGESAACVLVLATPVIIFATLYPHSDQPLPQWPFKVSINSLLSVYALVLKAVIGFILTSCIGQLQWTWFSETRPLTDMLHFDSATRGADGALGLIWRQRFRQPLTSLGCISLALAVIIDPFVQQLVRPVDCSVEHPGGDRVATLPRANVFTTQYDNYLEHTEKTRKEVENVLHDAIYSPGESPPWQCSSGNCTFPETYGTIGICYSCQDNSADVTFEANCSDPDSSYASHHSELWDDCSTSFDFTLTTNYTDGKNIVLGTSMKLLSSGDASAVVADAHSAMWPEETFSEDPSHTLHFGFLMGATAGTGGRTDWTTSGIDNSTCDSKQSPRFWSCQGYGTATCSLQPCVQIYNATITAGNLEERLTESSSDAKWGMAYDENGSPAYLALIDTRCSAKFQTQTNPNATVESRWLPYNFSFSTSPDAHEYHLPEDMMKLLQDGCLYLATVNEILGYASINLQGTIKATGFGSGLSFSDDGDIFETGITDIHGFEGPALIRGIYNWGHTDFDRVQSVFSNVSNSLTTYIRTHGGDPHLLGSRNFSRDVQGVTYHYATCVEVQWPWLAFPACLAILTTIFFLTVVGKTAGQGTSVWKASPLAWVLRAEGPGDGLSSSLDGSCEAMKERSTQIAVHIFDEDSGGPRIRMVDLKDPNMMTT